MRLPTTSSAIPTLLAALAAGCGSATTATSRSPAPAAAASGAVGDSGAFGLRFTGIGYGPDRVTYQLAKPAYVTIIAVTDTTIEPLMPLVSEEPRIEMAGEHTTGLNRGRESMPNRLPRELTENDPRVAELQEYNKCINRAIQYDKAQREASRRVIGRDSAGRPIYGPPEPSANDRSAESRCKMPLPRNEQGILTVARPAQRNRYLLVFVSDTPVRHETIVALRVSETAPTLFTMSIGRKLFGGRDAIWAGYFRPW